MASLGISESTWARRLIGLVGLLSLLALAITPAASASFSGQNGKIYFGAGGDIFSVNPDGSEKLDLTFENGFSQERPAASADGRHVVFQSFRDAGWNVISINADGSNPTDLTNTADPVINFEPGWSPDGTTVAFMRQGLTAGEQDLWTIGANGSGAVNLTQSPGVNETAPEFSPDGTKIVYISSGPNPCCSTEYNNDIWVMNANGTGATQLTTTDFPAQNTAPAWSPDGTQIAYSTTESPGDNGIHVMDANGANEHRLLFEGNPILTGNFSWSPDGTKIVYEFASGGSLAIMNVDGSGSATLPGTSGGKYPTWVPVAAGSTEPPPGTGGGAPGTGLPVPTPAKPKPKALTCKKGFKKKVVKGKTKCVKKHKSHKHKH